MKAGILAKMKNVSLNENCSLSEKPSRQILRILPLIYKVCLFRYKNARDITIVIHNTIII